MKRALFAAVAAVAASAALIAPSGPAADAAAAPTQTIYDATGTAPSYPSQPFEAQGVSEFGDEISFAGSGRMLQTVTVTLDSYACQQGTWNGQDCLSDPTARASIPVTLNLYRASTTNDDGSITPGARIKSLTSTFALPYRPSADYRHCTGADLGKWYDKKTKTCNDNKAVNVVFVLKPFKITVPDDVVISVSYNTTNYGPDPIGPSDCNTTEEGCFYDSLNVAANPIGSPEVGSKPHDGTAFINTDRAGNLCDGGTVAKTDVFNLDSPDNACWAPYIPAFKVTAK